jgi:tripartite-type tricarboxylate transporter receptor subunit TctC
MKKLISLTLVLALLMSLALTASASEVYKGKRVRIVIGSTSVAGDSYMVAETVNRYLQKYLEFNSKVDAVGANEAFAAIADAKPDGMTIMIFHDMTYLGVLFGSYDEMYKLENMEVGPRVGQNPGSAFAARADLPYNTLAEAAQFLADNPDEKVRISVESGGVSHIGFVAFYSWAKEKYGDDVVSRMKVVIGGSTDKKLQQLWDGNSDIIFADYSSLLQYTEEGVDAQLKVKFVGLMDYIPGKEDLPVMTDQGITLQGQPFIFAKDFLVYLPKGTPQEFIDALDEAVVKMAEDKDFIEEMSKLTYAPKVLKSAEAKDFIYAKRDSMKALIEGAPSFDDLIE